VRLLYLLAVVTFALALAGCRSAPPPPPDPNGVNVRAPFVDVHVPDPGR
jgi:hypothetical protein